MKIAIGSDHGGYTLKEVIKKWLSNNGYSYEDCGTYSLDSVDYPDYAFKVCEAVKQKNMDLGIVVCSSGVGVSIACNKVAGIYCALVSNQEMASLAREHNNSNVLALGAKFLDEALALAIVKAWLEASFSEGRHLKRIEKIKNYERKCLNG